MQSYANMNFVFVENHSVNHWYFFLGLNNWLCPILVISPNTIEWAPSKTCAFCGSDFFRKFFNQNEESVRFSTFFKIV